MERTHWARERDSLNDTIRCEKATVPGSTSGTIHLGTEQERDWMIDMIQIETGLALTAQLDGKWACLAQARCNAA